MKKEHQNQVIWEKFMQYIKEHINNKQSFKAWFEQIKLHRYENYTLSISVPSQFFCEWLEENYIELLSKAILHVVGKQGRLEYVIANQKENQDFSNSTVENKKEKESTESPSTHNKKIPDTHLNPSYQFDNLVEGDFNRLVKSIGQAISKNPGSTSLNPFVLYGPVGSGKTHTIHAIGNKIKERHPNSRIVYTSSEQFTNFFVESLRSNQLDRFSDYYKDIDVLLLDDIQYLSGKKKTQEKLFFIFNQLHQSNKQIIITSDCPPRDLQDMQERLLSRFKWGITAELQVPDLEPRIAIVRNKLNEKKVSLSDELIEYIASKVKTNIRELEGVVNSLVGYLSFDQQEANLDTIKKIIQSIVVHHVDMELNGENILRIVSEYYKVPLEELKGICKKREFVTPRQVSMYLIRKHLDCTLRIVGSYYQGGRDHSTVGYSLDTVKKMLEIDKEFNAKIDKLSEIITNDLQV